MKGKVEQIIGNYQGGFRIGKSTVDQIFILRQIFQKAWEFDKELHVLLFIDLKKFYDCIHRESLINILREFQFLRKLTNLIAISVMETTVKVKIGSLISDPIPVKLSLRQGDVLSPILFNLVLEKVMQEMDINQHGFKLQESSIGILTYADDVVLLEKSQGKLKHVP